MPSKPLVSDSPLTLKQRRFIKRIAEGKSASEAASLAGYSPTYGRYLMHQPTIKQGILMAMEKAGISDLLLAQKLKEGLEAMAPGRFIGAPPTPDHFTRKLFLVEIFKLRGDYAPIETVQTHKTDINLVLGPGLRSALRDALPEDESQILDAEIIEETEDGDDSEPSEPRMVEEQVSDRPLLSLPRGADASREE